LHFRRRIPDIVQHSFRLSLQSVRYFVQHIDGIVSGTALNPVCRKDLFQSLLEVQCSLTDRRFGSLLLAWTLQVRQTLPERGWP
jgi:hypothetical protein